MSMNCSIIKFWLKRTFANAIAGWIDGSGEEMWTGSSSRFRGRAFQSINLRKSFSEDTDGLDILDGMMDRLLPKPHTMHRMQ